MEDYLVEVEASEDQLLALANLANVTTDKTTLV